jgi:non-specific serine/threonine protein kinase
MTLDEDLVRAALPLYEVHGELGRGAWGVVIAGRHRQLGRDVAIKQLPRAFGADPAVRSRFVTEARLLASLDHTHIVPIYDFVEHEGLCLLVMERLTGGTLWSRFQAGALTPDRSCAVTLATCSALHYAHAHGVLHRDIKPDNLLFSTHGVLKVTDFGIAKVVGGSSTVATRAGDILGTPAYMAPEQAQGESLGAGADIYALGTVLYELLSGRLPFPDDDNPLTTLYRHVNDRPRPLAEAAPHVPPELAEVTERALETDPGSRYPDAESFGVALAEAATTAWGQGWLGDTGVTVAAPGQMMSAAVGRSSRSSNTIIEPRQPSTPPRPTGGDITPSDLLPVNLLRPEAVGPAPLVEQPSGTSPPPPDAPAAGPPRMADRPPPPPAPTPFPTGGSPTPTPSSRGRRFPRWLLAAGAAALVIAVVAALVITRSGSSGDDDRDAGRRTPPSSAAPAASLEAGAWRALRNSPEPRQQVATSVLGGTMWVLGGLAGEGSTAEVGGYDAAIDTWKRGPDLPQPLHHAMAATYDGELVVLGGWLPDGRNLTATTSDKVYALRNDEWVELPALNRPRAAGAAAVVGDRLVVFGGQANGELVRSVEVFDGERWTEAGELPTPREHLAGVTDGQFVYAVGGRNLSSDQNLGAFERFDPETEQWTKLPDLPTPRGGLGAAVLDGRIVTAGGESPTQVFGTVEIFDLAAGTWSAGPAMLTPRHGMALGVLGSTLYAVDGARQPSHTDSSATVEALDF